MFEFEATDPAARRAFFAANPHLRVTESPRGASRAERLSPLAWSEHCVECSPPACYTSCDLYTARVDGKCRRFTYGIHRNPDVRSWLSYGVEIDFKLISHLWTKGNVWTVPAWRYRAADALHRGAARVAEAVATLLTPISPDRRVLRGFYDLRKRAVAALQRRGAGRRADGFLLQVINPNDETLQLRLEVISDPKRPGRPYFSANFELPKGFSEHWVPVGAIERLVSLDEPFAMSLMLGNVEPKLLYLLCAELVSAVSGPVIQRPAVDLGEARTTPRPLPVLAPAAATVSTTPASTPAQWATPVAACEVPALAGAAAVAEAAAPAKAEKKDKKPKALKAVIFDLDNTLWKGVLIESTPDARPQLRPGIVEMIRALDERGILMSVASKNNHQDAWAYIEELGLAEYFLYPAINWGPKSQSIRQIVASLNIGMDTIAFVDDQPFERAEVSAALPELLVLDETSLETLLADPRFKGSDSAEARNRRKYYIDEIKRETELQSHAGDYVEFLRSCEMLVDAHAPRPEERERAHEVIQRTNQMNFSGNRYTRDELGALLARPEVDSFVMDCRDRFGEYGIVGFCATRREAERVRMFDLAMSCRVQAKHVEHAFLGALLRRYADEGFARFEAEFRRTEKNAPVAQVFTDLGFERLPDEDGREVYLWNLQRPAPAVDHVRVALETREPAAVEGAGAAPAARETVPA